MPETEVVVVGGGYWGSLIVRRLRAGGRQVICLDGNLGGAASRAASGLVRARGWETPGLDWWGPRYRQECVDFFQGSWVEERTFSNHSPQARLKGLVWCGPFEFEAGLSEEVHSLRPVGRSWLLRTNLGERQAGQVVLAAGCWCDEILLRSGLTPSGVERSRGVALLATGRLSGVLTRTYRLPGDTRTRSASVRQWTEGEVRLGDSLPHREVEQLAEMRQFLGMLGATEVGLIQGLRPRLKQPLVQEWAPGLVVATGGYRNGLALAPGIAMRVCDLLEREGCL